MQNTLQHLFIPTSNHQIRKGLLLIPELPGNPEDDAYEWIMVARNTALYTLESSNAFVLCRVRRMLPPEQNATAQSAAVCDTLGGLLNAPHCRCSSQLSAVQKSRFPSKPLMNMQTTSR